MGNILEQLRQKRAKSTVQTDKFGYITYETFIKAMCERFNVGDRLHIIEAVAKFTKEFIVKEGKLNTDDWEALWTPNTAKGAKKPFRVRHYMSVARIAEVLVRPATLHDHILAGSLFESVEKYANRKDDSEKVWQGALLPSKETLAKLCTAEISTNYATAEAMIERFVMRKKYYGTSYPEDYNDNLMHASDTPAELGEKRALWLHSVESLYRVHGVAINEREIIAETDARASEDFNFKDNRLTHVDVRDNLLKLREGLRELLESGRVELKVGGPGTGKTHTCAEHAAQKSTLWSLSNTVAFGGAGRIRRLGKTCEPMSFQKVRFLAMRGSLLSTDAEDVLIDEMSQLGVGDIDILLHAIEFVQNSGGRLLMMGDLNQIPSFLSRGSLLYSIIDEFPGIYEVLTVNHRVEENSRIIADRAVQFARTGRTADFSDFMTHSLSAGVFDTLDPNTVFITGANTQTAAINARILNSAIQGLGLSTDGEDPCEQLRKPGMEDACVKLHNFMSGRSLEFIGCDTENLPEIKIMRNERYECRALSGMRVFVQSRVDKEKTATLNFKTFLKFMAPAYAINVNKAQGLEWDNVILTVGDVFAKSDAMKTNYLLRSSFEHFYVGVTRAKKSLSIFTGNIDTDHLTLWPVRKFNLFKECI